MDMKKLLKQAKKMQDEMTRKLKEIDEKEFTSENNGIKVVITGALKITSLNISKDLLDDKETLEDLITIVVNNAIEKAENEKREAQGEAEKMARGATGGMF